MEDERFERLVRLLQPRWTLWFGVALATLAMTYVQWETRSTGGRYEWTEYYFYWPLYTYSHGDNVVGPSGAALTWNFFTGAAILYLPVAVADFAVREALRAVPASPPARLRRIVDVIAMRPLRAGGTLGFALVGCLIPPTAISLFTVPGMLGMAALSFFVPEGLPTNLYYVVTVPVAYTVWYATFSLLATLRRAIGIFRTRDRSETAYDGG